MNEKRNCDYCWKIETCGECSVPHCDNCSKFVEERRHKNQSGATQDWGDDGDMSYRDYSEYEDDIDYTAVNVFDPVCGKLILLGNQWDASEDDDPLSGVEIDWDCQDS